MTLCVMLCFKIYNMYSTFWHQPTLGKVDHTVGTIFIMYWYLLLCISGVRMCRFYERGEEIYLKVFRHFLSYFYILWTTKERTHSNIKEIIHMLRVDDFLKCHRNVTMHTYPL
jgi:hypothetical protein